METFADRVPAKLRLAATTSAVANAKINRPDFTFMDFVTSFGLCFARLFGRGAMWIWLHDHRHA
jgi:hypothetical protein